MIISPVDDIRPLKEVKRASLRPMSEKINLSLCPYFFFFSSRRRHTRFKCDWSSDVCSSDLQIDLRAPAGRRRTDCRHPNEHSTIRIVTATPSNQNPQKLPARPAD